MAALILVDGDKKDLREYAKEINFIDKLFKPRLAKLEDSDEFWASIKEDHPDTHAELIPIMKGE